MLVTNKPNISKSPSLPWPSEFVCYQQDVESSWKVVALHLHKELAGKSGASVYLAHVTSEESYSGYAILKLEQNGPWSDLPKEPDQLLAARTNSAEYATRHLPNLLSSFCKDSVTISLFSIAASGLEYVFPLAKLDAGADTTIPQIGAGLIEWSSIGHVKSTVPVTASALLRTWLGYRLVPEEGGRLHDFIRQCGISNDVSAISAAGTVYPNPLSYCLVDVEAADIYPLLGQQHGDCHGNNILVQKDNEKAIPNYWLIDFTLYRQNWPIFYDHAYLELSLLLDYAKVHETERWDALLTYCGKRPAEARTELLRPEDKSYATLVRSLRTAVDNEIEKTHRAIKASAESQQRLGRVAAGLNFANKAGLELSLRYKALIYAAHQLKDYFRFKNIKTPESGEVLRDPCDTVPVGRDERDWREVWRQCSEFCAENIYVLVVGTGIRQNAESLTALGKLPWSMVLDCDPDATTGGLLATAKDELKKRRGFHLLTLDQDVDVNFDQGTTWLMARGINEKPDTLARDFQSWRFGKIRSVDKHLLRLHHQTSPRQLRVLFLNSDTAEQPYFDAIATRILEIFHSSHPKLVVCHEPEVDLLSISEACVNVPCSPKRWVQGMEHHLGPSGNNLLYLPHRTEEQGTGELKVELHGFDSDALLNISEDLELVHPGLESTTPGIEIADGFLRGNTITWRELGRAYDVQLEMYPNFRRTIVLKLEEYTNETVELGHEPGAGGSTVARRLAWDLHREFPCTILRKQSADTAVRIASLYRLTHLPVLVIIEAGTMTVPERERLFRAVLGENARAVFVYVVRVYNSNKRHQVQSPLSALESQSFLNKYAQPDSRRMENLANLATSAEMMPYRMPFFFGLFAFEENFTHVESYVRAHLVGLSDRAIKMLRYLSMISCFSQSPIGRSVIAAITQHGADESFSIETVLANNANRLVIQDAHDGQIAVRVIHPLIAEQILRISGPAGTESGEAWKSQLESLSNDFINAIADSCGEGSEAVLHLLEQMYIQRENWGVQGKRQDFAQLILSISTPYGQARVLEELTNRFPGNAHFWHHRGRHSNLILKESYLIAEGFLLKAISLQPSDPLHHHALGMIYRTEIERLLNARKAGGRDVAEDIALAQKEIDGLFKQADEAFAKARELDSESEYGYVSNVQLILNAIEGMRSISGASDYALFFRAKSSTMTWVRSKLEKAKELLDQLVQFQGENKSTRVSSCMARYYGLFGDYDAMIEGLSALLNGPNEDKSMIRRLISDCIRNHNKDRWADFDKSALERIRDLSAENIRSGTPTRRDFINWFQAYRRLPGFNFNEAIAVMEQWEAQADATEAHYFLFALNFTKWQRNLTTSLSAARRHLAKISPLGERWTYEWLAKPEESGGCGLVSSKELGVWRKGLGGHSFYDHPDALLPIHGVVTSINDARSGSITIYSTDAAHGAKVEKFDAFFVPGTEFISGRDENTPVTAYIGFSYSGLRAWQVKRT